MLSSALLSLVLIALSPDTVGMGQKLQSDTVSSAEHQCLIDLGESLNVDQLFNEAAEWHLQLGSVLFYDPDLEDVVNKLGNASFAEPYEEMPIDDLLQFADEGVHLAKVALLQREDVDFEKQLSTAEELVSLGYTGSAISYLLTVSLISAEVIYEENGAVTQEVKQHLKDALRYVSFGIQRQDFITFDGYITHTLSESYPAELQHVVLLNDDDYRVIMEQTQEMMEQIRLRREEMNFMPLSQIDIPDIARHTGDLLLADAYHEVPAYIESLKLIDKNGNPLLQRTECIDRLIKRTLD